MNPSEFTQFFVKLYRDHDMTKLHFCNVGVEAQVCVWKSVTACRLLFNVESFLFLFSCFSSDPSDCSVFRNRVLPSPGTHYLHIPHQTNEERVNTELVWQEFTSLWNYFLIDKLIKPSRKGLNLHLTIVPRGKSIPAEKKTLRRSGVSVSKSSCFSNSVFLTFCSRTRIQYCSAATSKVK